LAGKLPFNQYLDEAEELVEQGEKEKAVKKIANAEWDPSEKEPEGRRYNGINAVGIVIFDPVRIPRHPFYKDGQHNQQNPTPAFHKPGKETGKQLSQ
jgi:hypothetical protein